VKIINCYLIKKFIGPFVITFLFALVILLMQFLWLWVDELVGKGLEIKYILRLLFYASATMVSMAAPLAVLLSSLMTFGSMGEHYELVALKASGIPLSKLMLPLAILCILIGIGAFWFTNDITPKSWLKMKSIQYNIKNQKPTLSIDEGVFYDGFDNYIIRIGKKHRDNETIEDVLIYDHSRHQGNTTMTYASKGTMSITPDGNYLLFYLYDGYFWDESKNDNSRSSKLPLNRAHFKEQYKRFDLSSFEMSKDEHSFYQSNTKAMSIEQLEVKIDTISQLIAGISDEAVRAFYNGMHQFQTLHDEPEMIKDTAKLCIESILNQYDKQKLQNIFGFANQASYSTAGNVRYTYEDVKFKNESLWSHQIEWHRKFTSAAACFLFFFIGASLGSIIRKGGIGVPLLITVVFFVIYFALSIFGEKLAKGSAVPVWFGMWLSTFVLIPLCIFLTRKATTDSAIFSIDEYTKWFAKLKKIGKNQLINNENITDLS
jgi:lipopolysaccharide export system permease protein